MERRVRKVAVYFIVFSFILFPVIPEGTASLKTIHIPLWAELDAFPGTESSTGESDSIYDYAIRQLKKISPMLITGMVYGWTFTYIPYDKTRAVKEFFDFEPINRLDTKKYKIKYTNPWIKNNALYSWIEFNRTPEMIIYYQRWQSIKNPKINGTGKGAVYKGFDGIQEAAENAVKDAVRTYFRKILKNKPKKIEGRVIISGEPVLMIKSGEYYIQLDFFLQTDRILAYTQF